MALLDIPDVTGPNGSYSDNRKSQSRVFVTLLQCEHTTAHSKNLLRVRTELGLFLSLLTMTLSTKPKSPPNTGQMVTHMEVWSNVDKSNRN